MNPHNINVIARYEVKLLKRSWLFRIFAMLALGGILVLALSQLTPILDRHGNIWPKIAVPSFIPFAITYFYSIAQSVIVIFLAGSFLKRDKKLDTAEVIYVRPMSNADYIIGKTWGIVRVFIFLNIIALLIAAFFNLPINRSPFSLYPYLFYLLTISIPSLIFILGLSFTVMCLLKNQAVTFIVMLGTIGTVLFYLTDSLYGVFDFFGVNIPAIFSDITGHADIRLFLLQRLTYLLAGMGLICFTIALVKRLPHKPWKIIVVYILGGLFLAAACTSGLLYVLHYRHQASLRNEYIASFDKYADNKNVEVIVNDLTITPNGKQLTGKSVMKIVNRHTENLDEIILYLNPDLAVGSIESDGSSVAFRRENQVIVVDKPIAGNSELNLTLHYHGRINENICYTDVLEKDYFDNSATNFIYRTGKRYAWQSERYTLFTPECLWYPVSVAPVNPEAPYKVKKNFTDYTLTVNYAGEKTVLSQGKSNRNGDQVIFTNTTPLPGISLSIADYEKKSLRVDSVDYEIYYFKGHDYFSNYFTLLKDTLPGVIRELKNDLEIQKDRDYPFSKFVFAETPVQFAGYVRNWKGYTEYVQPEIVFIPERGVALNYDFAAQKRRMQEWRRHDQGAPDETELTINTFREFIRDFVRETVQIGWSWQNKYINKFNISPMFFAHTGFIDSDELPVIDIAVNTMLNTSSDQGWRPWGGIINDQQRANLYLEDKSFKESISDKEIKPEIFYELLKLKSTALYNYITSKVPSEDFDQFLKEFFGKYRFENVPFATFQQELKDRLHIDIAPYTQEWYHIDHTPTLFIKDVDANQIVFEEFTKYQIKFKVNNPSDVDGIISVRTMQGGGFGRGPRQMSFESNNESWNYIIPAGEAREIKIINDERPANVTINTNISHNLPTSHTFNFSKIDNTITDTTAGIFPIDPKVFAPDPNEIIIDNEDAGFRTIASNSRHKLKDIFQKKDEEKYKNFMPWWMPSQWTAMAADYCYGETINSAVYKQKGNGANRVEWQAEIPKDGYYEVAIWNPKMNMTFMMGGPRRRRDREERNQTYTIQYGHEKESITIDLEQESEGWIPLGNFYFSQGTVVIGLTDKVSGSYVIADAVKITASAD